MLSVPNLKLSRSANNWLSIWQKKIDDLKKYEDRVALAKSMWGKGTTATFKEIKKTLHIMSPGNKRCVYCEDSYADEIEHIYPKDLYPDKAFIWLNYVYACGPCNGPKNNHFALINRARKLVDISPPAVKPPNYKPKKPKKLRPAFIDPRKENPLDFIELDIFDGFRFIPKLDINAVDKLRAKYTIDLLRLNSREHLVDARREAYEDYFSRLQLYCERKQQGASKKKLNMMIRGIEKHNWQTVWEEMKRNQSFIPELNDLFQQAPEANTWTRINLIDSALMA